MPNPGTIITIQFGDLDTFCEELTARGPNVESLVRICQQVRSGENQTHGPLPIEHVFGHVSYLRRTAEVLHVITLHLYVGQRWMYADQTPDRAEVRARIDELYDRIRTTCDTLGLTLVDGSAYQEPPAKA